MGATASAGGFGGGAWPVTRVVCSHGKDDWTTVEGLRLAPLHVQRAPAGEERQAQRQAIRAPDVEEGGGLDPSGPRGFHP